MTVQWCRLWHDMPTDPKWRTIARKSGRSLSEVIAVFNLMMVCASEADERGAIANWSDEDAEACLDLPEGAVTAIRAAMEGKVIEAGRLAGWEKRQPKREDSSSERVRAHRERKGNASKRDETQRNAPDTDTDTDTEPTLSSVGRAGAAAGVIPSAQELELRCRAAAGYEDRPDPNLCSVAPIYRLLQAGCDLEMDILPAIAAKARSLQRPAKSWEFFVEPVVEWRDRRIRPIAQPPPRGGGPNLMDFIRERSEATA